MDEIKPDDLYTISPSPTGGYDIRVSNEETYKEGNVRGKLVANCPTMKMAEVEIAKFNMKAQIKEWLEEKKKEHHPSDDLPF